MSHTARLALTLAGAMAAGALAQALHSPLPWLIGPLLATAAASALGALAVAATLTGAGIEWSALPRPLSNAAQLAIAITLGTRFTPASLRAAPRWLGAVALGTGVMIVLSAGFAVLVAWGWALHPATVLLATSPGGIAEMAITASVLGLGVPVVTAFHVVRYAAVPVLTGPLWRREKARLARGASA